jgi:hypothetical protein
MSKLFFSIVLVAMTGCGPLNPLFAGGPYKGKVIDAETKNPIVGAVALAVWYRSGPTLVGTPMDFLDAEEALTDKGGEFVVGKHAPASLIPGTWVLGPRITIFYPGYGYFPIHQISPPATLGQDKLNEALEKYVIIELPPLKTGDERLKLYTLFDDGGVPNEKKPNLIKLLNQERKYLGFKTFLPEK